MDARLLVFQQMKFLVTEKEKENMWEKDRCWSNKLKEYLNAQTLENIYIVTTKKFFVSYCYSGTYSWYMFVCREDFYMKLFFFTKGNYLCKLSYCAASILFHLSCTVSSQLINGSRFFSINLVAMHNWLSQKSWGKCCCTNYEFVAFAMCASCSCWKMNF